MSTQAQVSAPIQKALDASRRAALATTVSAEVRTQGRPTVFWQFSRGRERLGASTKERNGTADIWDGHHLYKRLPGKPGEGGSVVETDPRAPTPFGPIAYGYVAKTGTLDWHDAWIADIARSHDVRSEVLADGHVRLTVPSLLSGRRTIELNPKWGYLIDLDHDESPLRPGEKPDGNVTINETRVLAATQCGAAWVPTRIVNRNNERGAMDEKRIELVNIKQSVERNAFVTPELVGDKVVYDRKIYQVGRDRLRVLLTSATQPPRPPRLRSAPIATAPPSHFGLIVGLAAVASVGGAAVLLYRRRQRLPQPKDGYWGPS